MPDSLLFTEWMFSSDYIGGHWISYSEPVSELLTQEHTHDPIGCAGGRGVRCGDEWWSAGVASVETGHGRKTGIDVWRDRVRGVTLEDEKQKRSFFSPKCVWRRKNWFICWILYFSFDISQAVMKQNLLGGGGCKERAASAASVWCLASWRQASRQDQIKHWHNEGQQCLHW